MAQYLIRYPDELRDGLPERWSAGRKLPLPRNTIHQVPLHAPPYDTGLHAVDRHSPPHPQIAILETESPYPERMDLYSPPSTTASHLHPHDTSNYSRNVFENNGTSLPLNVVHDGRHPIPPLRPVQKTTYPCQPYSLTYRDSDQKTLRRHKETHVTSTTKYPVTKPGNSAGLHSRKVKVHRSRDNYSSSHQDAPIACPVIGCGASYRTRERLWLHLSIRHQIEPDELREAAAEPSTAQAGTSLVNPRN